MSNKKCIIHMPFYVNLQYPSGSQIRPIKVIKAFKNIGYDVDLIMGYGVERSKQIQNIKDNILKGIKYDFLYSESSTEPTLLTEKNHMPKYPFMDFAFLKFCKENNIKIGLFYRDVYWRFPIYKKKVPFIKRTLATILYKYDLLKYNEILDILYLPTKLMYSYIPFEFKKKICELPPGIDKKMLQDNFQVHMDENEFLKLFYVGGLNEMYNLEKLFKAVSELDNVYLTVCCRENDWEKSKETYSKYLNNNIKIVHKSGKELIPYFREADICSLFFEPIEYRKFAMPVKLFEYMTYKKPILSTKNTATGDFVEKNNIGWNIDYSDMKLIKSLKYIANNKKVLKEKQKSIELIINSNTWEARAQKIADDLTSLNQ